MNAIRLVLSPEQSAVLDQHESDVFIIVHKPCRTEEPEINRRWCITLQPVSHKAAADACLVAMGQATAKRIKP